MTDFYDTFPVEDTEPKQLVQPWETDPDAVAYVFMTSDGTTDPEQVTELLKDGTPEEWAQEAAENWTLHVSVEDLTEALAKFAQERPDL